MGNSHGFSGFDLEGGRDPCQLAEETTVSEHSLMNRPIILKKCTWEGFVTQPMTNLTSIIKDFTLDLR